MLLTITNCVTITKGTEQLVTVNANVEGASVALDGIIIGTTPFASTIPKNQNSLTISKEGYETYTMALSKEIDPNFFGNIITGGTIGSITDFATGAAYTYSPSNYQVELRKEGETVTEFSRRFHLRQYALLNMSEIAIDLGNGEGEYLETLLVLSNLSNTNENIELLKDAYNNSNGYEIRFGQVMVDILQGDN